MLVTKCRQPVFTAGDKILEQNCQKDLARGCTPSLFQRIEKWKKHLIL